jgi:hypothetical protein
MADPRIFLNADGNMNMDMDIDDEETSDEESSVDDDAASVDTVSGVADTDDQVKVALPTSNDKAITASAMESEGDVSGSEADEEDATISVAVPVDEDNSVARNEVSLATPRSLTKPEDKIMPLSTTKGAPSPGLSLSATKRRSTSPGLSLLKRRKLPLSKKRKLPTSKYPNISMIKHPGEDSEGDQDDTGESQAAVQATITDPSQLDDNEQIVQAVPMQETGSSRSPNENTSSSPNKPKKFKPSMARPTLLTPSIASEKRILLHAGPADSLPAGWTIKHYKRTTGLKHTDRYWFSPLLKKKFRSLAQVGRFLDFLQKEADETKAWELFRTSPPGPDEIRSRNRVSDSGDQKKKENSFGILGNANHSASNGGDNGNPGFAKKRLSSGMPRPCWKLPLFSSPGLYVVPPPSIQKRKDDESSIIFPQQEENEQHCGPKIDLNDQGYITPSLLFDHALDAAGYTKERLAEATHFGSSIVRTVDDMFDSNLLLEGIELVPKELWNRTVDYHDRGENMDRVNKRIGREVLMDSLHQFVVKSAGSSSYTHQFEDMIPKSLIIESSQNGQEDYLSQVRRREEILKIYHTQKKANEDAMDAYEDAMDEWSKVKESFERKKARREAREAAAKKKKEDDEEKKNSNDGQEDNSNNFKTDGGDIELNAKSSLNKGSETKKNEAERDSIEMKNLQQKELKDPGPAPVRPVPTPLIEVPEVPIPKSCLAGSDGNSNTDNSEEDDSSPGFSTSSKSHYSCIQEEKRYLVAHLDPASFSKGGRYVGLLSNNVADPQFVGPLAPGVVGLNNISGMSLSSTCSGSTAFSERSTRIGNGTLHPNEENQQKGSSKNNQKNTKSTPSSSKNAHNTSKAKVKKVSGVGPTPTSTSMKLKKIMEKGDSVADALRESIIKAAVYASRTGIHSGSFVGSTGETFPDISKAFSNHAKCRPCARCKNNKQGAYHCRLKRKHTDKDHDGGSSYTILEPLFQAPLEKLLPKKK